MNNDDLSTDKPVNMNGICRLLNKTNAQVKNLIAEGMPYQRAGGSTTGAFLFRPSKVTAWYIEHAIKERLPDEEGHISPFEAKRRYEVAKMLQAELLLAKEREQVANIDDLMMNFTEALVQVRAKLVSMPSRLSGILSHQEEENIHKILEDDITETLETLSDYDHRYITNEQRSTPEDQGSNHPGNSHVPFPTPKIKPS